jgi:GH18 family chitinase
MLVKHGLPASVHYMHAMTYDAAGEHHSPASLATGAIDKARAAGLPLAQVTLGLPFYGRNSASGDWTTWEDLVQRHHPLDPAVDHVPAEGGGAARIAFNGPASIASKTALAAREGLGGVMVWEAGQDCRQEAVTRDGRTHGVTCPQGARSSLLAAMRAAGAAALAGSGAGGGGAAAAAPGEEGAAGDL